ncbi:hypothetical protein ABH931_002573 [Streptacidiphilus sp. MAP12-33]|uniref:hypothetical protein n=1 Tax=Streptacidiphilus sp. MAP12-33 TaxID=3156266 RepID=UPI0035114EE2
MTRSASVIDQCRASLGAAPRSFSWGEKLDLRIFRPFWMGRNDLLAQILKAQDVLLAEGRLVWGALVQANSLLFAPGRQDHPAVVIYSPDAAAFDDSPGLLLDLARQLYRLKGTEQEDPELAAFSRMLANELDREVQWEVPRRLTGGATVHCTVIIAARKHLPGRVLRGSTFPLLIAPDRTAMTMMLPRRFRTPQQGDTARGRLVDDSAGAETMGLSGGL